MTQHPPSDQPQNHKLIFWSITAALSGFLFGFDTVVISGAEKSINFIWALTPWMHGTAISAALWGTVLGSLIGGWPTDRFGRRSTLIWIGFLYLLSAIWSAVATDVYSFMIARFLGGVGVGISTVAAPLFISEISPANARGRLAGMFQFNIVFGILMAFLSNYLIGGFFSADTAWRWMLGMEAIPAAVYMAMCFLLPQSPRWLVVQRQQYDAAKAVLKQLNPTMSETEIANLLKQIKASAESTVGEPKQRFWSRRLRIPIMLAFLVAFFNQMSGINAILYFAPRIFGMAGMGESAALLSSVGIGVVNLAFTFVGLYLIDHAGRKSLLLIGSLGYILSLGLCAATFFFYANPFHAAVTAMDATTAVQTYQSVSQSEGLDPQYLQNAKSNLEKSRTSLQTVASEMGLATEPRQLADLNIMQQLADQTSAKATEQASVGSWIVFVSILGFIAAHAMGQGAVIWVLISEVFPNRQRAAGQALGSFTHWIFAALITQVFPILIAVVSPGIIFTLFTLMMVLQLIWVLTLVPETRGVPLEELQEQLLR